MIADRLGITKAAIYHHFRSRDEIVGVLMAPVLTDAAAGVERIRALPADSQPTAAREFYADFVVTHRTVISMVFFDRAALAPDVVSQVDRLVDAVAEVLSGGGDDAIAAGEVLIYGIAALVTRRQELEDDALMSLIARTMTGAAAVPAPGDPGGSEL
jgi:AcrR family transcriptional regulator